MANLAASWQDEWTDSWSAYGLPILPNFPIQSRQAYRTSAVETEAGYVQSFPLQSDGRRRWDLTWGPLSSTDKTTLMDFFDARTGSLQGFVWSHPIDGEVYVALAESKITVTRLGPDGYMVTAVAVELHLGPDHIVTEDMDHIVTQDGDRIIFS